MEAARLDAYAFVLARTEFYYRSILGSQFQHALEQFLQLIITGNVKKQVREVVDGQDGDIWVSSTLCAALWMSRAYIVHSPLGLFSCDQLPPSPTQGPLIQIAIKIRMRTVVMDLLQRGADLLALEPSTGFTALHVAALCYPTILLELVDHL